MVYHTFTIHNIYEKAWSTTVYHAMSWYTGVYHVIPCSTKKYYGIQCNSMVYFHKGSYYEIGNIGQIRPSKLMTLTKTLVHTLVTSRLDYCNALLHGLPQTTLQRLQRAQCVHTA